MPRASPPIQALGEQNNFLVDATEDAGVFSDQGLAPYRAVVFLNTTGDVLDPGQQAAFESFIRRGGGFVGIHAASDTEYDWPWYGALVGTYFRKHPPIQSATLNVVDPSHESTRHLPVRWTRTDEWYNFTRDLDPDITVLIRIDERIVSRRVDGRRTIRSPGITSMTEAGRGTRPSGTPSSPTGNPCFCNICWAESTGLRESFRNRSPQLHALSG